MSDHKRAAATASRKENRQTIRYVASNVGKLTGSDSAAAAVAELPPSMLSNLVVSLEAVTPGVGSQLLRSPRGAQRRVPGMHNNVFTETREHLGEQAEKINRGKTDPRAVSKVQLASALCERGLIERGAISDPLEAASALGRVDTRLDAIASGVMDPVAPGTKFDDLPPKTQLFYARHSVDEVVALTAVSQRISDQLFEDVTEQALVAAAPRRPDPIITQVGGTNSHVLTAEQLLDRAAVGGTVDIAEGVKLARGDSGAISVLVDGLRLPVDGDARVGDLLARIPAVDFGTAAKVPAGSNSAGMNTVVQSMLVGESPRAQSLRLAARRRVIERTFYGDTPIGYEMGADGKTKLLAGKARAHTAQMLASRPHSSRHGADEQAQTTRIEGFDLSRDLRFARAARSKFLRSDEFLERVDPKSLAARAPEAKLKRYAGDVTREDRDAAARAGFMVRHPGNTITSDYPKAAASVASVDWNATAPVAVEPPGRGLSAEHMDVRAGGARLVADANQVARFGRNPELLPARALVAEAKLGQAFEVWKMSANRDHAPRVLTAVHPVPAAYRGREAEFVRDVFPSGGAFTTKGYTAARSDGAVRGGSGRVKVRYLTSDGMPVAGGDVIESGATFRVVSTTTAQDGTIEVNAVADQVAADMQQRG